MDMLERRIRDAFATLLSRGAKALEQTAGELERTAGELRRQHQGQPEDAEQVWAEPRPEPDSAVRSAPLRAVPDAPVPPRPAPGERHVPPVKPPQTPDRPRPGNIDAAAVTADEAVSRAVDPEHDPDHDRSQQADRLRQLAGGTVSEIRAQLDGLSDDELRALRDIETGNRNRTTLLSAIDRALATDQ